MKKYGFRTFTAQLIPLLAVVALSFSGVSGAFSLKALFGGAGGTAASPASDGDVRAAEVPGVASPDAPATVSFSDVRHLVEALSPVQRRALLSSADRFKHFVAQEALNRSLLRAARANKLDQNPEISFLMERAAERMLAEIYLRRLMQKNMPADYPTAKDMKAFYEKNKSKFRLGERMHMWQIFIPLPKDADAKARARADREADGIVRQLRRGRLDFAAAAAKYSRHQASRFNGGYMGLLKVSDLLPAIREAVKGLKEGRISRPLHTADGIHIVKRGGIVAARQLAYSDVKDEVRRLMRREAELKIRKAVLQKVADTYPVKPADSSIDAWRKRLENAGSAKSKAGHH